MTQAPPVDIPPSIGGTGLAAIGGIMLGRLLVVQFSSSHSVPLIDWLIVGGVLGFVGVLLGGMLLARRKMGVSPTPESIRRQWIVVGCGLVVGTMIGVLTA